MACILYRHIGAEDSDISHSAGLNYIQWNGLEHPQIIEDDASIKLHWHERKLGKVLKSLKPGDHLVAYEAPQLVCSTSQILELLSYAADAGIQTHFVKYNLHLENINKTVDTQMLLTLISQIESDFISRRTTRALAKRKAAGLPLGRPKGRGNKSLKLDKYQEEIIKYMKLGISKASIAKLVDCHPQTLYDWLDRQNIVTPAVSPLNKEMSGALSD